MPRYFFDVDDGTRLFRDEAGLFLPGPDRIEPEARTLLENLAVPELASGKDRLFTVAVRDEQGVTIYHGSITLRIHHRLMPGP